MYMQPISSNEAEHGYDVITDESRNRQHTDKTQKGKIYFIIFSDANSNVTNLAYTTPPPPLKKKIFSIESLFKKKKNYCQTYFMPTLIIIAIFTKIFIT